jgi:DNA-binding NarL/FixJ family response regulator
MPTAHEALEATILDWRARHGLTRAEADILRFAAAGFDRKQIAHARQTAVSTVKKQAQYVLAKLNARSLSDASRALLAETLARVLAS